MHGCHYQNRIRQKVRTEVGSEARERTKNIRQICEEIRKWGKLVLKYNGKDIVLVPCNDSEDHNNKE